MRIRRIRKEYNSDNAKKLRTWEEYPNGVNTPTVHTEYRCPCGKGTLEYVTVPGFNDDYLEICCPKCDVVYWPEYGRGYLWELTPMERT